MTASALLAVVLAVHTIADQPEEVLFVPHEDIVEDLPSATPPPSFKNSISPRFLQACSIGLQPRRPQEDDHIGIEF